MADWPPSGPEPTMPSLLELQRDFCAALRDGAAPPAAVAGGALSAAARLAVYRNNMRGALTAALRLGFPAVVRLVGEEFFAAAAARFIAAVPPADADLSRHGARFPDFLAADPVARQLAYLADVARLEWAVNRALHADMMPAVTVAQLRAMPVADHGRVRFVAHPSLSLLALAHPARAIWQAVLSEPDSLRDSRLAAIDLAAPGERLAVLLRDGETDLLTLSLPAFDFLATLCTGMPLDAALDRAPTTDAAEWLATFIGHGLFGGCVVEDMAEPDHAG